MSDVADLKTYTELSKLFRHSLIDFVRGVQSLKGGQKLIEYSRFPHRWVELETLRTNILARELHAYMDFRAQRENLEHGFDVEFYAHWLMHKRAEAFFGIHVGENTLLWDEENPIAFQAWKAVKAGVVEPLPPGEAPGARH